MMKGMKKNKSNDTFMIFAAFCGVFSIVYLIDFVYEGRFIFATKALVLLVLATVFSFIGDMYNRKKGEQDE